MTDEEKAVEYFEELKKKKIPLTIPNINNEIKQAFLAGLKAGRPKWHKVANGDLPKENNLYLVAIKDNGLDIAYFNSLHWETKYNLGDFGYCIETVIAWCEIPKYEEE